MIKRSQIITEIKRRIREGLSRPQIVEGSGGVWGQWGGALPCVHVFEQAEEVVLLKPGLYTATLPIHFEYINRLSDKRLLFTEGRSKLHDFQAAMELDERMYSAAEHQDLCITYSMVGNEIVELLDNYFSVVIVYNFAYADSFLGYESNRH